MTAERAHAREYQEGATARGSLKGKRIPWASAGTWGNYVSKMQILGKWRSSGLLGRPVCAHVCRSGASRADLEGHSGRRIGKYWKNQWKTKGFETHPSLGADLRGPRFGQEGVQNEGLQNRQPRCPRRVTPIPPPVDPRLRPRIST